MVPQGRRRRQESLGASARLWPRRCSGVRQVDRRVAPNQGNAQRRHHVDPHRPAKNGQGTGLPGRDSSDTKGTRLSVHRSKTRGGGGNAESGGSPMRKETWLMFVSVTSLVIAIGSLVLVNWT